MADVKTSLYGDGDARLRLKSSGHFRSTLLLFKIWTQSDFFNKIFIRIFGKSATQTRTRQLINYATDTCMTYTFHNMTILQVPFNSDFARKKIVFRHRDLNPRPSDSCLLAKASLSLQGFESLRWGRLWQRGLFAFNLGNWSIRLDLKVHLFWSSFWESSSRAFLPQLIWPKFSKLMTIDILLESFQMSQIEVG